MDKHHDYRQAVVEAIDECIEELYDTGIIVIPNMDLLVQTICETVDVILNDNEE